ncbi:hypothetical protein AB4Y32_25275 [Paraburkholderia phymatum]|uniref:Uncharacterized protein n=1 Tax=Paraburkholderia phymatum TaxID=148447 RepID=A0ACC6U610_9BURK
MRTFMDDEPRVRIPIRKWEKVDKAAFHPGSPSSSDYYHGAVDEVYKLEVLINGEILACDVKVPAFAHHSREGRERFRQYVIKSLSHRIGAVIADEIQKSIV